MTVQDFLFFVNNNCFIDEQDFVEKFQTNFPRTISKNKLIGFYKTKDINIIKCPREFCQNISKYKQKYCSNYCCREDFKERNIVHKNWETTRKIRCENMKKSNSKRTKEFYQKRKEKYEKTCLERYGETSNVKLESTRINLSKQALKRWENKTNKEKEEFANLMRKVNTGRPSTNGYDTWPKEKQIAVNRKCHETKKKNGSYGKSKEEDAVYEILCSVFFQENIERQYKSKLYPFSCDFYIKSLDLYIELQGMWTHGSEPYDNNNIKHQEILKLWKSKNSKFYDIAIKVWTESDPKKRQIAKENNLNWIEFWSVKEVKNWLNSFNKKETN